MDPNWKNSILLPIYYKIMTFLFKKNRFVDLLQRAEFTLSQEIHLISSFSRSID